MYSLKGQVFFIQRNNTLNQIDMGIVSNSL